MLRFLTAGESHGPQLTVILEGFPAGLTVDPEQLNYQLQRRQKGHGRGRRMDIESDRAVVTSGVRHNRTLGSPITLVIENRDWENWADAMAPFGPPTPERQTAPRPGHADLPGAIKYHHGDIRNVLERASARETAARTAAGALARQFLEHFGVRFASHVVRIGPVAIDEKPDVADLDVFVDRTEESPVRCADGEARTRMIAAIDDAASRGDSLGGTAELIVRGLPVGLGSYVHWERRLDARLGAALMSIPSVKGVEIGAGFAGAALPGSAYHDEIVPAGRSDATGGDLTRTGNNAGGVEGGMTNGEDIIARVAAKPIATLRRPLRTVDLAGMEPTEALVERSDVCVIPAVAVIAEAVSALVLADAFLEKFGGDNMHETERAWRCYVADGPPEMKE